MDELSNNQPKPQLPIKASDEDLKGRYANAMYVNHTKEEFFIDFLIMAQPAGQLVSRISISPGHMKRIINVLQDNFSQYEKLFGQVEAAAAPEKVVGFQDR